MRRTELIARLFLTALGLYLFVTPFWYLPSFVARWPFFKDALFWKSILMMATLTMWYFVFYQVWFNTGKWAGIIVGSREIQSPPVKHIWFVVGLNVIYFIFGALLFSGSIQFILEIIIFLVKAPSVLTDMLVYRYVDKMFPLEFSLYLLPAYKLFNLVLGVYLLAGAPHLLRWQLRRLKLNKQTGEQSNNNLHYKDI